jgi:predicted nucleotidyltransferase
MGSNAYGVANPDSSDFDIYGMVVPPKSIVFPHTAGCVIGFDEPPKFEQWQEHHVKDESSGREYDFSIFNIVKYFKLLYDNNPNIVDSLFVPENCIKHITTVGQMLRDKREIFLSKRCWFKFRGYAASQFHKLEIKNPDETSSRAELVKKYGYDTKFAYHIIRLLDEAEQILLSGSLQLDKNNEELKAIRRGEWTYERLKKEFELRKLSVESSFSKSSLREEPDKVEIRNLLIRCLETHYGSITEECVARNDLPIEVLRNIQKELEKVSKIL